MQPKSVLTSLMSGLIILLAGSIILLFTTPPESYGLFSLFILLAAIVEITIEDKRIILKVHLRGNYIGLHFVLILASITLVILQLTNFWIETVNAVLYVIVLIFGLGFFLLNILKFKPSFSRIEYIALAYPLSIASLAIIGTITLFLPSTLRGISTLTTVTFLSMASLFVRRKEKQTGVNKNSEIIIKNNELILSITLILFIVFFVGLYPKIASFPGLDISRDFLYALSFSKDTFGNFYYLNTGSPLFSIYQSSLIYIVRPSVDIFQITAIFVNIFALLSFYAMASLYLKRYGDHTPAMATLIWSTFAGFGFLDFVTNKINNPNVPLFSLIQQTDVFSYGDVTWRRLFFYLPMEVSFTLVFATLYLIKRTDLSRTKQVFLMTLLITPIPLIHQYGVYLLLPMLLCFAIVCTKEMRQQLKYTSYSLMIASFAGLGLNYILYVKSPSIAVNVLSFSELLLTGLVLIVITSLRGRTPREPSVITGKFSDGKYTLPLVTFLILLSFAFLLLWPNSNISFNFNGLNTFGYVPSLLYPVKLGVAGVLSLVAIYILFTNSRLRSKELVAFFAVVLLMIFVSRLLSSIQMQYVSKFTFDPNSWLSASIRQNILSFREERMFELFKIPLAILASIVLSDTVLTTTKPKKASMTRHLAISGLVSLILISGMASTLLGFEYYYLQTQTNPLKSSELNIINTLQNNIYVNGKATIISPQTPTSYLDFTGATTIATEATAAWESKSPEFPLFVTRYSLTTPTYIYLNKIGDYQKLDDYTGNYLAHIANVTPTYLENQEVQIKQINCSSIPVPSSATALVVPFDLASMSIVEPFLQSKQYTVASLFFGYDGQYQNFYEEPINYANVQINGAADFNGVNSSIRINSNQTSFAKIIIEFKFQPLDITSNRVVASKFDYGTPSQKGWEIAQYGQAIGFKLSPDGQKEILLSTPEILQLNTSYTVKCVYDGTKMQILVNNEVLATRSYNEGIFESNTDITIGAELYNNRPTAYAEMLLNYIRILNNIPQVGEPIFYAYDLLSSMGLNYTTTLSSDSFIGKYETLVLPYDDTTTQAILGTLETSPQESNTRYIVVLNTNGYGPLLDAFGNKTSVTFQAGQILSADDSLTMDLSIEVPKIDPNDETKVEAQYVGDGVSSPFAMAVKQGKLTLIYVNIYPLLSQNQILNPTSTKVLARVLRNYIELYEETTITPWFTESSLLFSKFQAQGRITVSANSIASIELPENQTINANSYASILINSTEITVQSGYGYYTTLIASNPYITLQGNQTFSMIVNGNATFLTRQPEISVDGEIQFQDFYILHPPTIYSDGRPTKLSGKISLNIYVSDAYTIALPYKLGSTITVMYDTPLMQFDEKASILQVLPYIVLISIFAVTIMLIKFQSVDPKSKQKEVSEQEY